MGLGDRAKRAASAAKSKLSSSGGGPKVSQVGDEYIVIDGEETHGPYDKFRVARKKKRDIESARKERRSAKNRAKRAAGAAKSGASALAAAGERAAEAAPDPEEFEQGEERDGPMLPAMGADGDGPLMPGGMGDDLGGDGPQVPMSGQRQQGDGPMLPDLGGGGEPRSPFDGGEMGEPMSPFGELDDGRGEPQIPMLDDDGRDDDDQPPWMF